jgi:hypothetical protein
MKNGRSSISKARTYKEIGEYWDTHSLSDVWEKGYDVEMQVDISSQQFLFPLDKELSSRVRAIARQRGVSSATLLNLWVKEMVGKTRMRKLQVGRLQKDASRAKPPARKRKIGLMK